MKFCIIIVFNFLTEVYGTLRADILQSMLGLCCDETYDARTDYNGVDDDGDNDGNEDRNENGNAAPRSGSYSPIFDPITTLWSHGVVSANNGDTTLCIYTHMHIYGLIFG